MINFREKVHFNGKMEEHIKVIGWITNSMDMEYLYGPMVASMMDTYYYTYKVSTLKIKNMVVEISRILMVQYIKVSGLMEKNMELEHLCQNQDNRGMVNGRMVNVSDGPLITIDLIYIFSFFFCCFYCLLNNV